MGRTGRGRRSPLMVRVWAELGAGHITEAFITAKSHFTDGLCDHASKRITINPVHQTVDTVLHELLHRLHPAWSENYIRNRTTFLRRRMSDEEILVFYEEYQRRKRSRRTPVNMGDYL